MVSCSDDLPDPPAHGYPDTGLVFEDANLKVSQDASEFNLKTLNEQNVFADVAHIDELVNFPAEYNLVVYAQVAGDANFSNAEQIETTVDADNKITINPDMLNGAIQRAISKAPGTYDVYIRYLAYAKLETTNVRLGGMDAYYGSYLYKVTSLDPTKVIENAYYLVGNFCNWDITKAIPFTNTQAGANQYDNPQFSIKFDVPENLATSAEGYRWMIIPASTYASKQFADGAFGVKGEATAISGLLNPVTTANSTPGVITSAGPMLITVNMETETFSVSFALDQLYAFSATKNVFTLHTDNYIEYKGVAALGNIARIGERPTLGGTMFKQSADEDPVVDENNVMTGKLTTSSDGKNIKPQLKGTNFYWVEMNLALLTYKFSPIESIAVIGSGNGGDLASATELTHSSDFKVWTAKGVKVGDNFKLCCNHAWTLNFGGAKVETVVGNEQSYNLNFNGDNMEAKEGTYDIEVNFGVYPYTITLK